MNINNNILNRSIHAIKQSFRPAIHTAVWVSKLLLPITLAMAVADYFGILRWLSDLLSPIFAVTGLSGQSALIFISSVFGNVYSAIGVMATVGVDYRSALILASMCLISHNLIIETAIQHRAGAPVFAIVVLRVGMSFLAAILLNAVLPSQVDGRLFFAKGLDSVTSFQAMILNWAMMIWPLLIKMFVLIISLNILQSILREFKILDIIAFPLQPAMKIFGLPLSTSFLWIICNVVGLTYGGAAIIDEIQNGKLQPQDVALLQTHVGISHSLLEDTLLFIAVGLPVLWIVLPRMTLAIGAVWIQRASRYFKRRVLVTQ